MIKFLINRPVAVFMGFTAFFILGIITYLNIPVSLLPDIAIPEITVQVTGKDKSARELENTVVSPIRRQLLQIGKMRDIRTETRDGNAIIRLSFEYGTNTDLAFIEVNEKIDAAMNYIPREIDRPRVIKASATDIPVFNLNLTLKDDKPYESPNLDAFLDLSEVAEKIIKRRIEQLPEISMVDISGVIKKQVAIYPDNSLLTIAGITLSDIETALYNNNIEPGSMLVKDGYYEYNIRFSSVLRTVEDIENIYIRKNNKIIQLKDIAQVSVVPEKEKGLALCNGKRAIVLSLIKQSDENMKQMQKVLDETISHFRKDYPTVDFSISQNQTELLSYTISNLQQNLILAFIFVCLVSALFIRDVKSPLIIGLSMFISLVISLLFFYLFNISLNIISLTGLILALGMMIDNSIIVTDNIDQYRRKGYSIEDACVKGTNEVITPMLSSAFTTIAVFVPLIFLSGIAGAIFFDQAFSVTVGLLVSYFTGIMLLPVLYKLVFSVKEKNKKEEKPQSTEEQMKIIFRLYESGINWVFSHKWVTCIAMIAVFPACFLLFSLIPKEKMPDISQNEIMVYIEWNENVHVDENKSRVTELLLHIQDHVTEDLALIAQQDFILNREREQTASESQIYLQTPHKKDISVVQEEIVSYFDRNFPFAIVSFSPTGTVFEKIFTTGEPDLIIEYYNQDESQVVDAQTVRALEKQLRQLTGEIPAGNSFQEQLNLSIDRKKLLQYNVSYDDIYRILKTGFREYEFSTLRSYQQYLPIVLSSEEQDVNRMLNSLFVWSLPDASGVRNSIPLNSFVSTVQNEDLKTIISGKNGEYIPVNFYETKNVESIIQKTKKEMTKENRWEIDFSGSYFSNKKMIGELMVILFISILLMYFILAAQFEDFKQPLIVLIEIPIDIAAALGLLLLLGHTLNLMSAIGIVVTCGIVINDSILKIDIMNQLREEGYPLMEAIHEGGKRRLKAIILTSLTTIVCMAPLLFSSDMGSELEKPLAIATIGGMLVGTPVSLFIVPLVYWFMNKGKKSKNNNKKLEVS